MIIDDRIITFESYYDPMLAHIIRTRLQYNGIACFIADENFIWTKPYLNQAAYGVKLKIFETDLERCRAITAVTMIDQAKQDPSGTDNDTNATVVCSYCASGNVRLGVATQFRFHWPSVLVSLFMWFPVYFRTSWHCFNCHRDFNRGPREI